MTEQQRHTCDVLNRLYEAEMHSVLPRLCDLQLSASGVAAQSVLLRRLAAAAREHREWLVEFIDQAGGAVSPASLNPATAMLHYLSIRTILPLVRRDLEQLLGAYDQATRERFLSPDAGELIGRIARRYGDFLQQLKPLLMKAVQPIQEKHE